MIAGYQFRGSIYQLYSFAHRIVFLPFDRQRRVAAARCLTSQGHIAELERHLGHRLVGDDWLRKVNCRWTMSLMRLYMSKPGLWR